MEYYPLEANCRRLLSEYYRLHGQPLQAINLLREQLRHFPNDEGAREALQRLMPTAQAPPAPTQR